ncbi:MAG: hypothetical protein HS111_14885 [Kofleriaceae bacterium]|nr:hypothetical protein [Kofleriaceae bacterium]MCL4225448.1 hypothetical protein [Myxococcales bacterium]
MARLFISNTRLEAWSSEGKISLEGTHMVLSELGRAFSIKPAVFFARVAGGDPDPHDLLGKVKDEDELASLGADHMASSVIYVDTAYEVVPGFVGAPAI